MTTFLAILLIGCIITIVLLWGRCRDLTSERDRHEANADHWFDQWKAACRQGDNLQSDLQRTSNELAESRNLISAQRQSKSKLCGQLTGTEKRLAIAEAELATTQARLADAELRIAAATENLTNQPRVIVEDEFPF